jgi:hypothetical protein
MSFVLCVSSMGSGVLRYLEGELAQSQELSIKSLKDVVETLAVHRRMLRSLQCKQENCQVYEEAGKVDLPCPSVVW